MKLTVLGATGPTGRQLVTQALAAGHDVIALVRDPARLAISDPHLTVITGDATDASDLSRAFAGADAVLSALGSGNDRSSDIASRAAGAIVAAASTSGLARVVLMSAFGVGDTLASAGLIHRGIIKVLMAKLFADKAKADDRLRSSELDWTLVYPVTLTDGPVTGAVSAAEAPAVGLTSRISRADVAAFMLDQVGTSTWSHRTVVIQAG